MKVAIIGAGINGLMSALELSEQGIEVHIYDQQQAGREASWAGGGILSPMYPWRYPQPVNALAKHAKALYTEWNQKLLPATGIDFQIQQTGMLIFDQKDFDIGLNYANTHQEPMQICQHLTQKDIQKLNPKVSKQFQEALFFPELSNVRNPRLLQSLINYLKHQLNVTFHENIKISKFCIQDSHVTGIEDEQKVIYSHDHTIIATGAWSVNWSAQLNLQIPVYPIQGQMVLFKTPKNWLTTMCMNEVMYLIPRKDGHIVCGSSMKDIGFDKALCVHTQQNILNACFEMIPELQKFPMIKQWTGLRPSSPTGIPYIGAYPQLNNLWLNTGHFRNGLCMGAASARLLRQLILKQPCIEDPTPYQPSQLLSMTKHL